MNLADEVLGKKRKGERKGIFALESLFILYTLYVCTLLDIIV